MTKDLVSVDWYIIPLLNPDGYEYSHEVDRMWRKNRAPPPPGTNVIKQYRGKLPW
jgi:murein tripeptide amidase MpaA